jgi:hypothetical protein
VAFLRPRKTAATAAADASAAGAQPEASESAHRVAGAAIPLSMFMAVFVVTLVGRPSEWIPGLGSIPVSRIAFLITLVAAFRMATQLSPVKLFSLPNLKSAVFFMGLAVFSIVFSIYKGKSLEVMPGPLTLLLSMILLVKCVPSVKDAERILVALVISAIALTIGTLRVYQGGRAEIGTENASYDPNDLAYVLITMLPIATALFAVSKGLKRLVLLGGMLAMLFTIMLTGSRGGVIGLGMVAMLMTFKPISLDKEGRLKEVGAGSATVRVAGLLIAAGLAWLVSPPEIKDRLKTFTDLGSDYNMSMTDNSSRLLVWSRNSMAVVKRPIGYGLGTANAVDGLLGGQFKTAHNTLVQCFVELGFIGLFLLLRSYYVSWRELRRAELHAQHSAQPPTPAQSRIALYSRALRFSLVGNITAGFFLSQAYGPALWTLIAVCAVFVGLQRGMWGEPQKNARAPRRTAAVRA